MNNIDKGVIQVLDQLKNSGQLNSYLIDDDERKWTKLVYDIMINKFDMPFGNSTMQQASDIFNNAVRVWKGKNKLGNMINMESRTMNKKLIRLTESDLHRIVKESVNKVLTELDWKTYMNYSQGRANQGDAAFKNGDENMARKYWDKSNNGVYSAKNAFGKQYNNGHAPTGRGDEITMSDVYDNGRGNIYTTYNSPEYYNRSFPSRANGDGFEYDNGGKEQEIRNLAGNYRANDVMNANKDVNDYKTGKSQYVSGQGWK